MDAFLDDSKLNVVKKIAQELDCGCNCFYNIKTMEIVAIPHFDQMMDEDSFSADLKNIDLNKKEFIKFEVLENFESFKIMEQFVALLTDLSLQTELEKALANKKPFQNFKYIINHSSYIQHWFDFKQNELEKRVEIRLERSKLA